MKENNSISETELETVQNEQVNNSNLEMSKEDQIKNYYLSGKSISDIEQLLGDFTTKYKIQSILYNLKIISKVDKIIWENEKDNLEYLVNTKQFSDSKIGTLYGVSPSTITRKLKFLKIARNKRSIFSKSHTDEEIINAVTKSNSIAASLTLLGLSDSAGNRTWIAGKIQQLNINIDHHTGKGWAKGKHTNTNKKLEMKDILVENSTYQSFKLKNRLLSEGYKEHKCECCGNTEWNGKPIPLELHHKDGNHFNNKLENLQILCPNCHAQTDNYKSKNITKSRKSNKYSTPNKDEFLNNYKLLKYRYKMAEHYKVSGDIITRWVKELKLEKEVEELRKSIK